MKNQKLLFISLLFICTFQINAQNKYQLSIGTSLPDHISKKYLGTGIYLSYGIDLKFTKNLFLNTNISIDYNNYNKNYRFGLDDNPYLESHPAMKEIVIEREANAPTVNYSMYLFNPYIGLNFKYLILPDKKISPYLFTGISCIYSLSSDPVKVYEFNADGFHIATNYLGGDLEQQFNIGYQAGIGLNYNLKDNKTIFIESHYKLQPNVKFGLNDDRVGLFIVNAGISFPFK